MNLRIDGNATSLDTNSNMTLSNDTVLLDIQPKSSSGSGSEESAILLLSLEFRSGM